MHQMSFDWVLSTAGGLHLAKTYGEYDDRDSSLRVEEVGMLSMLLFISLMENYRKCTNIKIKYVSDNLELIKRS